MSKIFDEYAEARLKKSGRPTAAERIDAWLARGKIGQQQQAEPGADEPGNVDAPAAVKPDTSGGQTVSSTTSATTATMGGSLATSGALHAAADERAFDAFVKLNSLRPGLTYREVFYAGFRAAQSGQRAGVADGWQLVPVEPTDAMTEAAQAEWMKGCADPTMHVWDAMLAAAQGVQHG